MPSLQILICCVLVTAPLGAQVTGSIRGDVKDPSGYQVAGARVVISNPATGLARESSTDHSGDFAFPNLPLGAYRVEVAHSGFAREIAYFNIESNIPVRAEFKLKVANADEHVDVMPSD